MIEIELDEPAQELLRRVAVVLSVPEAYVAQVAVQSFLAAPQPFITPGEARAYLAFSGDDMETPLTNALMEEYKRFKRKVHRIAREEVE